MASSGGQKPIGLPIEIQNMFTSKISRIHLGIVDLKTYRAVPGGGGNFLKAGSGMTVRIVDPDNPVSFGLNEVIENNEYLAGPMFLEKKIGKSNTKPLAIIEDIDEENWKWDFMTDYSFWWTVKIIPEKYRFALRDRWVNYSSGKTIWVTAKYGEGKVVVFGGHPEYPFALSPPRIIYNALFYAASQGPFNIDIENSVSQSQITVQANGPYVGTTKNPIIEFNGTISEKNNVDYTFIWNFGDGEISQGQKPVHKYKETPDEYTAIVVAIDEEKNILKAFMILN